MPNKYFLAVSFALVSLQFALAGNSNVSLKVTCDSCSQADNNFETRCEFELRSNANARFSLPRSLGIRVPNQNEFSKLACEGARDWTLTFDGTLFEITELDKLTSITFKFSSGGACIFSSDTHRGPYYIRRAEDKFWLSNGFQDYFSNTGSKKFSETLPVCDGEPLGALYCALQSQNILTYYCAATDFILKSANSLEFQRIR